MLSRLTEKLLESAKSVLPICILAFLLHFTITPMPMGTLALFITGSIFLMVGVGIFTMESDIVMMPMGEMIGSLPSPVPESCG